MNSQWLDEKARSLSTPDVPASLIVTASLAIEARMKHQSLHWNPLTPDAIPHIALAVLQSVMPSRSDTTTPVLGDTP